MCLVNIRISQSTHGWCRQCSQARGNKLIEILDRDRAIKGRLLMIVFYNPQ